MKKDIPLTIESITDADEQECRITSSRQIASILRNIAETGSNAALYYNSKRDFIMTTILDVDEDGMWVEQASSATVNHQIEESKRIKLVSSHNQVKVQFGADGASSVTYDERPAFFIPIPDSIYRFQRREYFRLSLLPSEQMRCIINMARPEAPGTIVQIEVPVADISGGGIGLTCMEGEVDINAGESYSKCQINLPGVGPVLVNLIVRNLVPVSTTKSGKTISRAGCEFKDLDGQTTVKLQRFITDKQRLMAANATSL
ncbi:MAG TPA: flagellar brake protein [Gallionella sp.]|nr:flagellar brake protein [Gallionella sp.]